MGFGWCAGLGRAVGMLGGGAQPWLVLTSASPLWPTPNPHPWQTNRVFGSKEGFA